MDSAAMAEEEMSLLSLPDDALLAVLAFLPARQLFVCRVACRRLRDLCLHSQLWRAATVEGEGVLRAALALAPCIGTIAGVDMQALEPLVAATACTVSALQLSVCDEKTATLALALLSRLSTVCSGLRLRKLTLAISGPLTERTQLVLKAVYAFNGLQDLTYCQWGNGEVLPAAWGELKVLASLTKLRYGVGLKCAFVKLLLTTHSATLEEVDVRNLRDADVPWSSLASLPRLRSLKCTQGEGLSLLAALPNLSCVALDNESAGFVFPPGALEFLLKASQLRTVKLYFSPPYSDALLALGNSPSALTLERIDMIYVHLHVHFSNFPLGTVASVLPKFPSLKCLIVTSAYGDVDLPIPNYFNSILEELLQAVSPASSPCLTMIELHYIGLEVGPVCLHAALHCPLVPDALVRNPRLHLRVLDRDVYCKYCQWCSLEGCHVDLQLCGSATLSLSSHSRTGDCPPDCYQAVRSGGRPYAAGEEDCQLF